MTVILTVTVSISYNPTTEFFPQPDSGAQGRVVEGSWFWVITGEFWDTEILDFSMGK